MYHAPDMGPGVWKGGRHVWGVGIHPSERGTRGGAAG